MKQGDSGFRTTRWSVVNAAAGSDSTAAREALAVLCDTYWYPLYVYVRRSGFGAQDAEDLTQGFLARLLEKRDLGRADPQRGRFRAYLLGSLKHFLANERDRAQALKRGGGRTLLSIDFLEGDRRFGLEADEHSSPERLFERQWALALLERTLCRLREEYVAQNKQALFDALRPGLLGREELPDREALAASLGLNEGTLNTVLHRLRKRFRARLRREVAHTVDDEDQVEEELQFLRTVLGS